MIIRSHICVEWILYIDHSVSKRNYTALCKEPPLSLSGPTIELLCSPMCDCNTKGCILFFLSHFWLILIFVLCGTKTHPIFLRFFNWTRHMTAFLVIFWTIFLLKLFTLVYIFCFTPTDFFSVSCHIAFRIFEYTESFRRFL